jgi:diguanylate cyclase (GGDEF)-like protein
MEDPSDSLRGRAWIRHMPRRVLIAEDDNVSRRVLQAMLEKWGYQVVVARDGAEAWEVLQKPDSPALAILDWMMPGVEGVELCRRVRRMSDRDYVYVILLTARDRREDVIGGMEGGADDYLIKPIDSAEFRARLGAANRILELQSQLLAARDALRDRATHDPLTGLWNRSATLDALERDLARAQRQGAPLGVLMADLDYFKRVNDTFGHDAGDDVLRQLARRTLSFIRAYDTLGRYGGDEFLIVAPDCDAQAAVGLAERIRQCIANEPVAAAEGSLPLTISIGVTTNQGGDPKADALVQAADQAMYRAKNAGRNRVEIAPEVPVATAP